MTSPSLFADTTSEPVTMTSTEIVDFINAHRKQEAEASGAAFPSNGFPKLERKNFLAKVPEVLGAETSAKFSADLPDSYGRLQPGYRLPKREATLLAMSYSYTLQAAVYDHMTALENKLLQSKPAPAIANTALTNDIAALDLLARVLNVADSGKLGMMRVAVSHHAPHLLPALPGYAIDAPKQVAVASGSSEPTFSLTHLLQEHGVAITAAKFNAMLADVGIIERRTRNKTSSPGTKVFWSVTEAGLPFGKNVSSDKNQRETQPHWYASKFAELLDLVRNQY